MCTLLVIACYDQDSGRLLGRVRVASPLDNNTHTIPHFFSASHRSDIALETQLATATDNTPLAVLQYITHGIELR